MFVQVQKHFKPELLNRLSEIVVFEPLLHDKLKEIVKIQMKSVIARVADKGISLFASEKMLVRFDMSEYVGSGSVLRLVGAPPR